MRWQRALALSIAIASAPTAAHAWEASTHAGLVEQGALAGGVDAWLRELGFRGGLFEPLVVPPADAPELNAALANYSAADGFVPDLRGQQSALGWIMAGAALGDATVGWAANHFFDPATGAGWQAPSPSLVERLRGAVRPHDALPARGVPAPTWVTSADNPFGLAGFLDQYEKAIAGSTPGERGRAMAGALVAAGAMCHVLADLGSPSRVRGDEAAHLAPIGLAADDVGSRFERLVAVAWGRLGIPAAASVVSRPALGALFTGAGDDTAAGLADWTAARFFSEGTLPRPTEVGRVPAASLGAVLAGSQARPLPALPRRLSMVVATQPQGTTLKDRDGTCLARYRKERGMLSWWLDDACQLEQAAVILPVVGGYQAALLRWLARGQLAVTVRGGALSVATRGGALGAGTVTLLAEDGRGVRTAITSATITTAADATVIASAPAPKARVAYAVFRGVDGGGEPVVAFGRVELP